VAENITDFHDEDKKKLGLCKLTVCGSNNRNLSKSNKEA
jgi:hypothetical protein